VLYHHTDRLLLGMFVGSVAVTLYEGPARLVALLVQLTGFGNTALIPFASQLEATRRNDTLESLLLRGSRYVAAIVAPSPHCSRCSRSRCSWAGSGRRSRRPSGRRCCSPPLQAVLASLTVGHTILVATGKLPGRLP
jgi:hypothetical protein